MTIQILKSMHELGLLDVSESDSQEARAVKSAARREVRVLYGTRKSYRLEWLRAVRRSSEEAAQLRNDIVYLYGQSAGIRKEDAKAEIEPPADKLKSLEQAALSKSELDTATVLRKFHETTGLPLNEAVMLLNAYGVCPDL